MAQSRFIEFKGKRILRSDINNCSMEQFEEMLEESGKIIRSEPLGSVLSLAAGGPGTPIFTNRDIFVEYLMKNMPYIKASAVSGLDRLKASMFLSVVAHSGRELMLFETEEEAKEWLASR
ncbi:MAG: hypothetical protein ABSA34_03880 [Candidatus Goldiibacteriota bacterium]